MHSVTLSAVEGASGESYQRDVLILGRNCKASSFDVNLADTVRVFKIDAAIRKPFRRWAGIPRQTQTRKT